MFVVQKLNYKGASTKIAIFCTKDTLVWKWLKGGKEEKGRNCHKRRIRTGIRVMLGLILIPTHTLTSFSYFLAF